MIWSLSALVAQFVQLSHCHLVLSQIFSGKQHTDSLQQQLVEEWGQDETPDLNSNKYLEPEVPSPQIAHRQAQSLSLSRLPDRSIW